MPVVRQETLGKATAIVGPSVLCTNSSMSRSYIYIYIDIGMIDLIKFKVEETSIEEL